MESTYKSQFDNFILKWIPLAVNMTIKINVNILDINTVIKQYTKVNNL